MRPAGGVLELGADVGASFIQLLEAVMGVGLQDAAAVPQMVLGILTLPVGREEAGRTGRRGTGPWALLLGLVNMPCQPADRGHRPRRALVSPPCQVLCPGESDPEPGAHRWLWISTLIRSVRGCRIRMALPHQSTKVVSGMLAPIRAKISFNRFNGR